MFGIENYLGFIIAGTLLNLTPGTDSIYIITRSISQGLKAGVYSVLGIISGSLIHTVFATLGLSAILSSSPLAFMIVKVIGAIYLCYLGLKLIVSNNGSTIKNSLNQLTKEQSNIDAVTHWKLYKQGILTNVLNPKVALFFLAFFPQFIDPNYTNSALSFLILGLTFSATGLIWCLCLALLASRLSKSLRNNPYIETVLNKLSGVIFIGLGLKIIVDEA